MSTFRCSFLYQSHLNAFICLLTFYSFIFCYILPNLLDNQMESIYDVSNELLLTYYYYHFIITIALLTPYYYYIYPA